MKKLVITCAVCGAETTTGLAVEILVEQRQIPPRRVGLKGTVAPQRRDGAIIVATIQIDQAFSEKMGDLLQVNPLMAEAGCGHGELWSEEAIELFDCLDQRVIGR